MGFGVRNEQQDKLNWEVYIIPKKFIAELTGWYIIDSNVLCSEWIGYKFLFAVQNGCNAVKYI